MTARLPTDLGFASKCGDLLHTVACLDEALGTRAYCRCSPVRTMTMTLDRTSEEMRRDSGSLAEQLPTPDDGVDVSLIRWMLSLTPAERLDVLSRFVAAVSDLRDGIRSTDRP